MKIALPFKIMFGFYAVMGVAFGLAASGVEIPMVLPYKWHKLLHITGAIMFLGNVVVTGLWSGLASRMQRPAFVRFAIRGVVWADVWFTGPGFLLAVVNGVVMLPPWGGLYGANWLIATLVLFGISGVLASVVMPLQVKLWRLCEGELDDPLPEALEPTVKVWAVWGSLAVLPLLGILAMMVLKPEFGGG